MFKKSYRVKYLVCFTVFMTVLRYQLTFYRKYVMDRNYYTFEILKTVPFKSYGRLKLVLPCRIVNLGH